MALQHLRSSTANKRPLPAGMSDGQLAINTNLNSPGVFFKDSNGDLVKVGPVHVGATAPNVSPATGGQTGNTKGEQWLDTSGTNPVLKIWDGSAWQSEAGEFVNVSGDTMTGALGIIAGSAASPSLFISGDANTGLYSPGADQVAISTGGTGRLFVDASGNVGVGTNLPAVELHVHSTSQNPAVQITRGAVGSEYGYALYGADGATTAALRFFTIENGAGTGEKMRLDSSGRLGVGTSSPNAKLEVVGGNIRLDNNQGLEWAGSNNYIYGNETSDFIAIATNGTERSRWDSSGRLLVGTSSSTDDVRAVFQSNPTDSTLGGAIALSYASASPADGDWLSRIDCTDSSANVAARIVAARDGGTWSSGSSHPGRLVFSTTADGASSPTERLAIRANGNITYTYSDSSTTTSSQVPPGLRINNTDNTLGRLAGIHFAHGGGGAATAGIFNVTTSTDTSSAGSLGDLAFYLKAAGSSTMTERLRIDSSGRVGIGTASPGRKLEISTAVDDGIEIIETSSGNAKRVRILNSSTGTIYNATAGVGTGTHQFQIDGGEALRIDGSKRLLVGTSTQQGTHYLQIQGSTTSSSYPGSIFLRRGLANASIGDGNQLGVIDFGNQDGGVGATISAEGDAQWGSNDYPGRLVFATTADGASSPTERMRITQNGTVIINDTAVAAAARLGISADLTNYNGVVIKNTVPQAGGQQYAVFYNSAANVAGAIQHTGTTTVNYSTSSDYRLKENVVPLTGAAARVNQLKPSQFNFITDPGKTVDGFIAHEAQAVVPECVTGTKDAVDADGKPVYQGIDQSKLVPLLTAALQEALAEIESLKARVTALEP